MGLKEYKRKRRFNETPEPAGEIEHKPGHTFVVQKHRATRLHYDFRLEMEGVLRSWAIPKGPSFNPAEKRLAMETEDHPIDYGDFEGVIPKGNYGAGNVIIWDKGTYEMVDPETPEKGWTKGKLHFILRGHKLKGEWVLVKGSRDPKGWIFFKVRDSYASAEGDVTEQRPESVISGLRVEEAGQKAPKQWVTAIEQELETYGMKEYGRAPMPKDVQPMLATLVDKPFDSDEWIFELKLDGVRAIVVKDGPKLQMWTRNAKPLTHRFPALAQALFSLPAETAILDGEIVALDEKGHSHFSLIQPRIHLTRPNDIAAADEQIPVYFYAFDLLYLNGYNLMKFPLIQRKAVLRKLIHAQDGWVRFADHVEGKGTAFFEAVSSHNLEGTVAKLKKSEYRYVRSRNWLKIKTQHTDHFVVAGFTPPEGSRKHFGALLLGLYDRSGTLVHVGRAGGGFDDRSLAQTYKQLKPLITDTRPFKDQPPDVKKATWVRPELVCEVRFSEWTSDKKLRAPIFQGFRDDVDPKECRLEDSVEHKLERVNGLAGLHKPVRPASRIEFTNLDKVLWPEDGYTKGDLIHYYDRVSPYLIPHLTDRPLVFERFPDGIYGQSFYQKDAPGYTPDWIRTQSIWSEDVQRHIRYFIGADRDQLLYAANMGNIQHNPWMSRIQHLDCPDYIVFDLDPVDAPFPAVQEVAIVLREVLDELGLRSYPKTSGASGIHVFLPILENTYTYEESRIFAKAVASIVVRRLPKTATIQRVVRRRKSHEVYVDYLQNIRGKTVASVYSVRPRQGAPVSAPLTWEELDKPLDPKAYTIETIFSRLDKLGDLFEPVLADRQDISGLLGALKSRRSK